jgi:hypothetical protein
MFYDGDTDFVLRSVNPTTNQLLLIPKSAVDGLQGISDSVAGLGSAATRDALGVDGALYSRDSILGTVSQSSGVPTGAIIETISNASGVAIRFANGTQICMRDVTTGGTSTPVVATWAAEFVGDYRIGTGPSSAVNINIINVKWTAKTSTSASFLGTTTTSSGNQSYIVATADLIAIGRWY